MHLRSQRSAAPSHSWFLALALWIGVVASPCPLSAQQGLLTGGSEDESSDEPSELEQAEKRIAALRARNAQWQERAAAYQQTLDAAPGRSLVLDQEIARLEDREAIKVPEDASVSELDARALEAEQDLSLARQELLALDAEVADRAERRKKIPELLAVAKQKLAGLEAEPSRPVAGDPAVAAVLSTLTGLERKVLESEIQAYQNELSSYDARGRLLNKERDRATMRIAYYESLVTVLRSAAQERERVEVALETEAAESMIDRLESPPPEFQTRFRQIAGANRELAEQWTGDEGLIFQIDDVSIKLARADKQVASLETELNQLAARVDAVGLADSVGVLLRQHRAEAPDVGMYRRFIRMRQDRIGAVQLELIKLRERRRALADIDVLIDEAMATVSEPISVEQRAELQDLLRRLFEAQRKYLDALMADYETYFQKLVDFDARQQELIDRTEKLLDFVDERILWVPSGRVIEPNLFNDGADAMGWLFGEKYVAQLGRGARDAAGRGWLWHLLVLIFAVLFLPASRRIRERLRVYGEQARDPDCDRFATTMEALLLTFVLAGWLPLVLAYVGWRLGVSPAATQYTRDIASALIATACIWFTIALPRQFARPNGIAEAHTGWPAKTAKSLFTDLAWLGAIYIPSTFFIQVFEMKGEDLWRESVGRLFFLVAMLAAALFNQRQFRSGGCATLLFRGRGGGNHTVFRAVQIGAIGLPLALGVAAARGFFWTALQVAVRFHLTLALGFLLVFGVLLFARWSMIASRQNEVAGEAPDHDEPESGSGLQVSRLMVGSALLIGLFGTLAIWADLLPASRIFEQVELWKVTRPVTVAELDPSGVEQLHTEDQLVPITLRDLFRSALIFLLTVALVKNLPNLLEATLFRRLGAGERYAYSTIVKYIVVLVGLSMAFDAIGIGWSSIQWLVAAIGLGLGFGLQEIFGNFISGLIILLERPIRVGDTVTVGDVSGTVSKIRIRATSITGFDRKELIVPNKSFVTSQLVNWTLSDSVLRCDIPVGIAYGSDTEKAMEVLKQVAAENRRVIRYPRPEVLFLAFGDSTLSFELRVYVSSVAARLPVLHELHMAIDKAFREADIEIAFPQHDLHVRSVPDNWRPPAAG